MIKICNIAIYYHLLTYSNIQGRVPAKAVARETMMLASEVNSNLVDELGRVQSFILSFILILGRVGSLPLWVGSRKLDTRLTLHLQQG